MILMYLLGIIAGAASTAQASVNSKIRESFRSPYVVTVLSFIISIIVMALIVLVSERDLYIPLKTIAAQPFWIWLGGSCGTAIIILNILCLPKLGSARNVMIICFGQTLTGLVIDHYGMFGSPVVPMTLIRTAGAAVVLVGVALVNGVKREPGSESVDAVRSENGGSVILYVILALLCGFACASQIAINGTLNKYAGSAGKATLISMAVGLITTLLVIGVLTAARGKGSIFDGGTPVRWFRGLKPWMAAGALLALTVVGGNAVTAPVLGTGIATIMNLIGMMGAGLIIDATGFLGIEVKPVTAGKVIGMILMVAGTAVISLI